MGGLAKGTSPQSCSPCQQGGGKVPSSHPSWKAVTLLWRPWETAESLKPSTYGQRGLTKTKLGKTQLLCSLGWRSARFLHRTWGPSPRPLWAPTGSELLREVALPGPHDGQYSSPHCAQPCNELPVSKGRIKGACMTLGLGLCCCHYQRWSAAGWEN